MDSSGQLREIVELAGRLGIEVRQAALGGDGGGLCRVGKRQILFVDSDADTATRTTQSLRALAQLPELDKVWIAPALRERIDAARDCEA